MKTPEQFREELREAIKPLERVVEKRPPRFSEAELREISYVLEYTKSNYFKEERN